MNHRRHPVIQSSSHLFQSNKATISHGLGAVPMTLMNGPVRCWLCFPLCSKGSTSRYGLLAIVLCLVLFVVFTVLYRRHIVQKRWDASFERPCVPRLNAVCLTLDSMPHRPDSVIVTSSRNFSFLVFVWWFPFCSIYISNKRDNASRNGKQPAD